MSGKNQSQAKEGPAKENKLTPLINLGLLQESDKFDNLTVAQIELLVQRVTDLKENKIDELVASGELDETVQKQLEAEVVKRRQSDQKLANFKQALKAKADSFLELVK